MKRILLFTMCFTFTFATLNAQDYNQVIFTGDAGTDAWEDPENWRRGGDPSLLRIPEKWGDIIIEGFRVNLWRQLLTQGDLYL